MKPIVAIVIMLAVMVIGLVLVTTLIIVALSGRWRRPGNEDAGRVPLPPAPVSTARTHARRVHVAAWCAFVLAMAATAITASSARGLEAGRISGLILAAGGVTFLVVSALGEVTWPRPTGSVRTATLARRSVRDVTPRPAALMLALATGLLLVALVVGGLTALSDGRSFGRSTTGDDGLTESWASSPYPGWFYAAPLALAAGAILLATLGCVILIARRPAISDASSAWDLAMRQLSAQRTLRGTTLALSATAAPVYGVMALPFLREGPWPVAALLVLAAVASIGVGAATVALPSRPLPAATQSLGTTLGGGVPGSRGAAAATDAARRIGWNLP